jgi:uncharacterized protein YndB with AHSA1/START domain
MTGSDTVEVSIQVAATPEELFPYFTDPLRYVQWMGQQAQLDPVPGGVYRTQMGDGFGAEGSFLEIDPPVRLVFTWGWAAGAGQAVLSGPAEDSALPPGSTRVEVMLVAEGPGTLLTLRHCDLPTADLREGHRIAWQTYLDRLAVRAAGGDPGRDPHSE